MKKLKLGTVDLALPSTVMSSQVPAFGLFEMPYLVKNRDHMAKIRDQVVVPTLVPIAEKAGYHIIGVWENGFRQITNNKHPIKVPSDLQGIKLRVPGGTWRVKMFKAYGANPSPLAFSEVFVALQTGVMDGEENPLAQIYPARFYEVQKYLSMTGHVYTPAYVTAGASWSRLPADVQKILADTAVEMQPVVYKIAADLDERPVQEAERRRHAGQRRRQGRLHQGQQADLRRVRQGSARRQGTDRQVARARKIIFASRVIGGRRGGGPYTLPEHAS